MKYKTSELTGALLDAAVAMCVSLPKPLEIHVGLIPDPKTGFVPILLVDYESDSRVPWSPSTDWSQGGPLLYRYEIGVSPGRAHLTKWGEARRQGGYFTNGKDMLEAGMRCLVLSELGEEVEL